MMFMASSNTVLNDQLRAEYLKRVMEFFTESGEDTMVIGSNEMCFPVVDSEGNDKWIQVVVKVPGKAFEEDDGYSRAEAYRIKCENDRIKAEEKAKAKAEKIAKDEADRKAKAEAKAKRDSENK